MIRSYTKRAASPDLHVKVFVRPEQVTRNRNSHSFYYRRARCAVQESGRPVFGTLSNPSAERAWINHYAYKSLEDYLAKAALKLTHDRIGMRHQARQPSRAQEAMRKANDVTDTSASEYYRAISLSP